MGDNSVIKNADSKIEKVASAGPAGWIAYSIACWLVWAPLCGFVENESQLLAGCIAMACFIVYMGAAITELKLGNVAGGCTWLYFAGFFAFGSSLCSFAQYFAKVYNLPLDIKLLGFEWLIIAIVLILTTPIFAKFSPLVGLLSILAADVGLLLLPFIYWGVVFPNIQAIAGWAFFLAGFFGTWLAVGGILSGAGIRFPVGSPLLERRN